MVQKLEVVRQPDEESCGPSCLHAIYRYFGDDISLSQVCDEVEMLNAGGTLAPLMASHALRRSYRATIHSFNVMIFDPTWFDQTGEVIKSKLLAQLKCKRGSKFQVASKAYLEFLELGGELEFHDLNAKFFYSYLSKNIPLIVGLSSTFFYKMPREHPETNKDDDVCGDPSGHFLLCHQYNESDGMVKIYDPYFPNKISAHSPYWVSVDHLICSLLLGVVTYDANILVLQPPV